MLAIGQVESGRVDVTTGEINPWPWATNNAGEGHYFSSVQEAIAWVAAEQSMGNQSITGVFLGAEMATPRAGKMIGDLVDDVAAGRLTVLVDRTYPLAEAAEAHAFIESRKAVGRVVLIP